METNETTSPAVGGMEVRLKSTFFIPTEELKDFYLKEAVLLCPQRCTPACTEYELLCMLQSQYKTIVTFFAQLTSLAWDEGLSTVYTVTASYMMQSEHSVSDKKRVSASIAQHVGAVSSLLAQRATLGKLQGIYNMHCENLSRLISQCPEYINRDKKKRGK